MVSMLRLIPGLLLLLYIVESAEITKPHLNIQSDQTTKNAYESSDSTSFIGKVNDKITDADIENIVKPFKFETISHENLTTIKLKKSESYTTQTSIPTNSRTGSGRFVDIDIEKYISPDFHNAVYTLPTSQNTNPNNGDIDSRFITGEASSFESLAPLTTPKTPFFDQKYKDTVESVNKNIEKSKGIGDNDNLTQSSNYTANNSIEGSVDPTESKLEFRSFESGKVNELKSTHGTHQDVTQEKHVTLSFESRKNHSIVFDETTPNEESNELHKDNIKYLLGDENELKKTDTTFKFSTTTDSQVATQRYSITKPSTAGGDVGIISNKIESESVKAEHTSTPTPMTEKFDTDTTSRTIIQRRGSIKFSDYHKLTTNPTTTGSITTTTTKATERTEPVVQENQVIPVQVTPPATVLDVSTNRNNEEIQYTTRKNSSDPTTIKIESTGKATTQTDQQQSTTTSKMETVHPDEQQSTTIYVFVQPDATMDDTTIHDDSVEEDTTLITSTPRGFTAPTRRETLTTTSRGLSVATIREILTSTARGFKVATTTETIIPTTSESLTEMHQVTALTNDNSTTSVPRINMDVGVVTASDKTPTRTTTLGMETSTDKLIATDNVFTSKAIPENGITTEPAESPLVTTEATSEVVEHTTLLTTTTTSVFGDQTTLHEPRSSKGFKFGETTLVETTTVDYDTTKPIEFTTISLTSAVFSSKGEENTIETNSKETATRTTPIVTKASKAENTEENQASNTATTNKPNLETTYSEILPKANKFATVPVEVTTETIRPEKSNTISLDTTTAKNEEVNTIVVNTEEITTHMNQKTTNLKTETNIISHESKTTTVAPSDLTSEVWTKIIIKTSPSKTLLENRTNEEKTTGELETSTTISFVHIKNIDINHTTLFPDVLKPNEKYTPDVASETVIRTTTEVFSSDESTSSPSELDGHSGNNGVIVAIVIFCVGGICLIALAGLLIVMRNRQKRFNYGQRCRPVNLDDYSVDNVSVFNSVRRKTLARGSKRSYGNPAFEDPVCVSHPLNFPAISKFASNIDDVNAEFNDIPQITARTSELPEGCETKNRYANVIPLPESRVFLTPLEGYPNSDYINANYVTGPRNIRKYYIACQAPMSNTVDDFWRMIWEQQCKVVLMLTHLFENGNEKCFDYLPPSEVLDCHRLFGDYQVTLKKREVKEKYVISSIQLKNMVSNSWREVTHFWYMGWPEKGVPVEANSIIAFLIEARSYMKSATIDKKNPVIGDMNGTSASDTNPVVVHCSPGTGRTGAVITCDIAIREFEQTRQVDIPKIVYRIRRDRANAVQTREQYAFIYKVIDLYATKLAGGSLESI